MDCLMMQQLAQTKASKSMQGKRETATYAERLAEKRMKKTAGWRLLPYRRKAKQSVANVE